MIHGVQCVSLSVMMPVSIVKKQFIHFFTLFLLSAVSLFAQTADKVFTDGNWNLLYRAKERTVTFCHGDKTVLSDVYVQVKCEDGLLTSKDYEQVSFRESAVSDAFGSGKSYVIEYRTSGKPMLRQVFYLYPGRDYFLTEAFVVGDGILSSNYMAPIVSESRNTFLPEGENRMLFVPFDNDKWVRYGALPLNASHTSYEVTAIFNGEKRNGLVIGSVEHDTWKTGIELTASEGAFVDSLKCFGGITSDLTRDQLPHGSIRGKELKSPKIFVGFFADWRVGMDSYGVANAIVAAPRVWDKGVPFGWNSWGAMKEKINYEGALDVAAFIKSELQPKGFENHATVYVDLDSFWDNFSDEQLKAFADQCKRNGQVPGIYWSPFADWGKNPERRMPGGRTKYKEVYLYANGKPQDLDGAYAIDPTHPAVRDCVDFYAERFRKAGFKYIKLDFLTHGALEADRHTDGKVTTGIQAYNEGMGYLRKQLGEDMYMALSIAPSFPAQYGHSKRISCDAWGSIADTEYVMNSLSYGWWLDKVYTYNDSDHVVLYGFSEGENRARVTSAVITGLFMLGDNFSQKGSIPGNMKARDLAKQFAVNPEINAIARMGQSFYPVEGHMAEATRAESLFMLKTGQTVYLAAFNYDANSKQLEVPLERLGLLPDKTYRMKELWTSAESEVKGRVSDLIPAKDVKVFRINLL